jgi:tyrosyl-tRNA synthetase
MALTAAPPYIPYLLLNAADWFPTALHRTRIMTQLYEEMKWRGLVFDATRDAETYLLQTASPLAYVGFDPTASSLHVGSLVPVMALVHLQRCGGRPIAVVGGGTGMVGDPSGRSSERTFLSTDELAVNVEGIGQQLARFLDTDGKGGVQLINNLDWLSNLGFLEFLRDTGKYYTVNQMLAKESVKTRLERAKDGGEGLSFTEFTYMLMQAYDFLYLYDKQGCRLQLGGSDQWGNITAGIELIGRLRGEQAYGLVMPLITTASGQKFGKSEERTVWLDAQRTSPYRFYQYWINTDDDDVDRYLKFFTLMTALEISGIVAEHRAAPHKRGGQIELARDMTLRVHGADGLHRAEVASKALFGGDLNGLGEQDLQDVFADVPSVALKDIPDVVSPFGVADICVWSGLAKSKGDARRLIQGGGVYLNNQRVEDVAREVTTAERLFGRYLVLRKGAKSYFLVDWAT